jgi:DNA mismatch repair protein MutS
MRCSARAVVETPPVLIRDGGVIADGYDERARRAALDLRERRPGSCSSSSSRERRRTGIANLKVGYNRVHGYYIEIGRARPNAVPADYIRRQTLKGAERFITPELKAFEDKVLSRASVRSRARRHLYEALLERLAAELGRAAGEGRGRRELDVLA